MISAQLSASQLEGNFAKAGWDFVNRYGRHEGCRLYATARGLASTGCSMMEIGRVVGGHGPLTAAAAAAATLGPSAWTDAA